MNARQVEEAADALEAAIERLNPIGDYEDVTSDDFRRRVVESGSNPPPIGEPLRQEIGADSDSASKENRGCVALRNPRYKKKRDRLNYSARLLDAATGNLSDFESDRDRRIKRHFRAPSLFIDDAAAKVVRGCVIAPYAKCDGADLSGADLRGADLPRADLVGTDLRGADLRGADLRGAELFAADLSGADLSGARLYGANLLRADLSGANLRDADLRQTELFAADLSRADLRRADLRRVDLSGANLTGANLTGARFCKTKMPDGSTRNDDC